MKLLSSRSLRFDVVIGAAVFVAASPAFANWLGKPDPPPQWGLDAAKTHTPAYATDADAVILYDEYLETVDGEGRAVERERRAVRILKPQGRDQGRCEVGFDVDEKINYFRVWIIAADEKQYQAQEGDFVEVGDSGGGILLSTYKARVARPPAVDVGSIVICESEELTKPYFHEKTWDFQEDIPAVFQALEVDLPAGRSHTQAWHNYKAAAPVEVAPNHWRWEVKDTPALLLRDVPSHPNWGALAARMSVQWGEAAVDGKDNQWRAIGAWETTLEASRPDPTPEITAQSQSLIAGAPDFYSKLSRITDYIQKNIRYFIVERGIGGWQAHFAGDIFRARYGDCKDKTTLLISMLQAAGIHAVYVPVSTHRGYIDPDAPSVFGNHMITAIEIPSDVNDARLIATVKAKDGKRYLIFDPTDERTPVGNLRGELQGSFGTLCAGTASQVIALPILPPDANPVVRKGTFTLAADGTLSGAVETTRSGASGGEMRMSLKYTDEKERRESMEKSVARDVPGVVLSSLKFEQPDQLDKPVEIQYSLSAAQYAHAAGPLLLLRPRVLGSHAVPFDDKPRTVPIDLGATGSWHDSYDIALPAGYVVDDTPDATDVDLNFAAYHSKITVKDNHLHYEREYLVRQVEIPAEKAAEFRKLERAILADEKGTAVLKKQ